MPKDQKPALAKVKNDDPHVHTEEPCNGPMCPFRPVGGIISAISGATPVQEAHELAASTDKSALFSKEQVQELEADDEFEVTLRRLDERAEKAKQNFAQMMLAEKQ